MKTSTDRIRSLTRAWPLAIALLLVGTLAAAQDPIVVTSATPDSVEQGTLEMDTLGVFPLVATATDAAGGQQRAKQQTGKQSPRLH